MNVIERRTIMSKSIDKDCIFCKINQGEIPSTTIYEDEDFKVILDINPASRGHAVILPKNHAANLMELPDEDAEKILKVAKKCAVAMMEVLHCDGINILQNNGEAAGQTVFHLHIHLIPRYEGDSVNIKWIPGTPEENATQLAEAIRAAIS